MITPLKETDSNHKTPITHLFPMFLFLFLCSYHPASPAAAEQSSPGLSWWCCHSHLMLSTPSSCWRLSWHQTQATAAQIHPQDFIPCFWSVLQCELKLEVLGCSLPRKKGTGVLLGGKDDFLHPDKNHESYYHFSSFARLRVVQLCQMRFFSSAECLMSKISTAMNSQSAETTADTSLFSQPGSFKARSVCLSVLCFVSSSVCHGSRATWGGGSSFLCHWK